MPRWKWKWTPHNTRSRLTETRHCTPLVPLSFCLNTLAVPETLAAAASRAGLLVAACPYPAVVRPGETRVAYQGVLPLVVPPCPCPCPCPCPYPWAALPAGACPAAPPCPGVDHQAETQAETQAAFPRMEREMAEVAIARGRESVSQPQERERERERQDLPCDSESSLGKRR